MMMMMFSAGGYNDDEILRKSYDLSLSLKVASGNLLALLSRHFQRVSCLKFIDDGSHFVSSGEDNLVLVWKMARYGNA